MADIAIFRINYKSDFILTLQSDAGWMTPFCIKFWTGAPSQAYYAYYDGMSYTHCTPVDGEPTKLLVQFDDHHLPIGDLKFQIGYHFTVADFPTSVEDEVINQASVIIEVDNAPAQVMLDFNGETAPEIQFALPAYANEAQRIANEQARIAAEELRIANEQARISAEETRQANEQQRINAEAERVSDFARLKTESEAATAAATTASGTADTAARNADEKAAAAQSAATLANDKAQLAADKAALAQSAATLANEKAVLAQQKAEYAQEQGDAAKTEAETAHALNEEVREDEEARDHAEQTRQQQEAARQTAESQRVTDFNTQMQQQQTAYTEAEGARETAFNEAEQQRDAKVDAKVADITNLQAQIGYFVCDTDADVAAKTIAATGYVLTTGGNIRIKMTNANTADSATLNINSTGAKALFYNGTQASSTNSWGAGEVIEVYYDGTNFHANNVAGGGGGDGVFDVSEKYPTSGVEGGNTYTLDGALAVLNTNLSASKKKGGMSIKFIQSSDNNYIQFRCMVQNFTTDVTQWAIADEGVYVENPEFVYVKTDKDNKILWAIKTDGGIYYGAGCPQQVKDYIEEKISSLSLDEYEDIVAFLNDYLGSDITLKAMIDGINVQIATKVDKIEGKSLIDEEYASTKYTINEPEFLEVKTDKDGKILEDITTEGRKEIHIPVDTPSCSVDSIDNPDWMSVETDVEGKILSGRKKDGTKVENNPVIFNDNISLSNEGLVKLKEDLNIQDGNIPEYQCVRDAAKDGQTGVIKVGSELYASVVDNPSELTHKQDAYANPYYDANSTLKQYATIGSRIAIPENICNRADQEEIDFTPSVTGKTRIIVGKSSHDVFFVARINCDYGDGVPDTDSKENCLEITTDFITFTPIFKGYDSETIANGLSINNCTRLEIVSVKEFANGNFIVAGKAKYNDVLKTFFFLLSKDFSSISLMSCTYLDGTVDIMADEFHNGVYDWHINIVGSKALVSTYGSRQPETDYGRVWYTEDNGVTWKQVFQMTNHYQDGVSPDSPPVTRVHTHGVMIDAYDGKLYVIAGEDNANLFWSDKGWNTTDTDWNVISIRRDVPLQHQVYMQVVNGYAFATNLILGSDCSGAGAVYRLNKLNKDSYSRIQLAHEFLPNKYPSTMYCAAGMYRRDNHTPLFMCETHENAQLTEEDNEGLNYYHRARVVATYDGINFTEIWTDDTYGEHDTYIKGEGKTTRNFCWCTRDMNFYLLNNGDAVVKYSGRAHYFYGGNPMYSVKGNAKGCCKVRIIKNIERFL